MSRWNKLNKLHNEINLHVDPDSQKLKADQNFLGGDGQKWVLPV